MSAKQKATATITVGDSSIPVKVANVPIDTIRYYRSNPRIFTILKQHEGSVRQELIEKELWKLDSTKDLFRDIQRNGGLLEEILVRDNEVLEGNSRLCAYRYLLRKATRENNQEGVSRWSNIRAKLLPSDVPDEAVFAILGILHIRGKAKWAAYEQASYLHRQSEDYRISARELAEQIGGTETEIKNNIAAFNMMDAAQVTDTNKFSYFLEYVKSRKMKEAAEQMPPGKELDQMFVEWVDKEVIPRAERVRDLPTILKDKKARTKFIAGKVSFEDALDIARDRHPETTSSFYNKLKRATDALENAEMLRVKDDVENDSSKKYILKNLLKTVNKFCKAVGVGRAAQQKNRKRN